MADRKQNQRADDIREAATGQDGRKNTSLQHNSTAKSTPFASRKRITTASALSFSETFAVLDEATELPPFGFNIAILEQRLERRLGFEVTKVRNKVIFKTFILNFYGRCTPWNMVSLTHPFLTSPNYIYPRTPPVFISRSQQ